MAIKFPWALFQTTPPAVANGTPGLPQMDGYARLVANPVADDPSIDGNAIRIKRYGAITIATVGVDTLVATATATPAGYPANLMDYTVPAGRKLLIYGYHGEPEPAVNAWWMFILEINGVKIERYTTGTGNVGIVGCGRPPQRPPLIAVAGQAVKMYVRASIAGISFVSFDAIELPA